MDFKKSKLPGQEKTQRRSRDMQLDGAGGKFKREKGCDSRDCDIQNGRRQREGEKNGKVA
jgi:hypothetical protein